MSLSCLENQMGLIGPYHRPCLFGLRARGGCERGCQSRADALFKDTEHHHRSEDAERRRLLPMLKELRAEAETHPFPRLNGVNLKANAEPLFG